jgi:hypothetical protein
MDIANKTQIVKFIQVGIVASYHNELPRGFNLN